MKEFSRYWEALNYAFEKYNNLKRKLTGLPYIIHPIRITLILRAAGYSEFQNEDLMVAALLHDLIEDTNITYDDIKKNFNLKVANIVKELSKPKNIEKDEWLKSFENVSEEAKIIKIADRIDNLRDMVNWPDNKKKSYAKQAEIILDKCGEANPELSFVLKFHINKYIK